MRGVVRSTLNNNNNHFFSANILEDRAQWRYTFAPMTLGALRWMVSISFSVFKTVLNLRRGMSQNSKTKLERERERDRE